MKLLPAQLVKLKWLKKNIDHLNKPDAQYVQDITNILAKSSDLDAHPITIIMIEGMYSSYREFLKTKEVGHA